MKVRARGSVNVRLREMSSPSGGVMRPASRPAGARGRSISARSDKEPIGSQVEKPGKGTKARALVLAPTRELALQIEANAKSYSAVCKLRAVALVGGESVTKQLNQLSRGADIIIATPGRLNDFILRKVVPFDSIEVFILDEADRMLDMGFLPQVRRIMNYLPRKRQTMLLSATLSRAVEQLAREMTTSPIRVEAARPAATVATLTQSAYSVLSHAKVPLLLRLLEDDAEGSFLVFTETKRGADRVAGFWLLTAQRRNDTWIAIVTAEQGAGELQSGQVRVLVGRLAPESS